jgi:ferredoxin hydrogenase large subunit/hydrogenase large subunit
LDFVDIAAITKYSGKDPLLRDLRTWVETQQKSKVLYPVAPFLPRYEGTYVENYDVNIQAIRNFLSALEMRKISHEMAVLFAGKLPHAATIIPGGIAEGITAKKIAAYKSKLKQVKTFVETCYIPDVEQIASAFIDHFGFGKGCGNYMAFGVFREDASGKKKLFPEGMLIDGVLQEVNPNAITEHIKYSFFDSASKLHPYQGTLNPAPKKGGDAYSWLKAPRYDGKPIEVGPLARVLVAYQKGDSNVKPLVDHYLGALGGGLDMLDSVMGRHLARALEAKIIAQRCEEWLEMLRPDDPTFTDFDIPEKGQGAGLTEAPRGALGHWLKVAGHKIENYQCVVPSTWNCSPRDDAGVPGPVEQALVGTPIADEHNPIEATRVVRAFDPCLACAVH